MKIQFFLSLLLVSTCYSEPCWTKRFEDGSVCACNHTYCDTIPEIGNLDGSTLKIYYTSNIEPGFNVKNAEFVNSADPDAVTVTINEDTHQKIIGFGAGFTDATGININNLNNGAQQKLLESFYGENGVEFTLMRVPFGASEYSTKAYTIDDTKGDKDLSDLNLPYEDTVLKIPFIQRALAIAKKPIKLIGSAWTAPTWMKKPPIWTGGSILHEDYYQIYANYLAKVLDSYEENNITYWGLTTGNEPFSGFIPYDRPLSMGWSASDQGKWLSENLAPTLKNSDAYYKDIKILILDDGLLPLPYNVPFFLENDTLLQLVDGVATHPNDDSGVIADVRKLAMSDKKDIFRLNTQANQPNVVLGAWAKADSYIINIFELLTEYDYGGWMESNLALDPAGGPSYVGQFSDAPVIVEAANSQFFKQPTFYAIGHFSKFVIPDSVRLGVAKTSDLVKSAAFLRPDGLKAVVFYNYNDHEVNVQIQDNGKYSSKLILSAFSLNTVLYKA